MLASNGLAERSVPEHQVQTFQCHVFTSQVQLAHSFVRYVVHVRCQVNEGPDHVHPLTQANFPSDRRNIICVTYWSKHIHPAQLVWLFYRLHFGYFYDAFIQRNLQPVMHTFTHRRRGRACRATASWSGAVRVRRFRDTSTHTLGVEEEEEEPGIQPATFRLPANPLYLLSYCRPPVTVSRETNNTTTAAVPPPPRRRHLLTSAA